MFSQALAPSGHSGSHFCIHFWLWNHFQPLQNCSNRGLPLWKSQEKKKEPLVLWDAFVRSTLPTHPNHKEGGTFQTTYMSVRVNPADGIFQVHTKHGTLDPVLNRCMVLALNGIFLIVLVENTHSLLISSHALGSRPLALHYNFL